MAGRRVWFLVGTALMVFLLILLAATGCGSKKEEGPEIPVKGAEEGAKPETAAETPQAQDYVFSVTVSSDTKTDTFKVSTTSQVLHYNLTGGEDAKVTITIFSHPEGKMVAGANAFEPGPHQKTIYLSPGTYNMEILPTKCTVEVKVQD